MELVKFGYSGHWFLDFLFLAKSFLQAQPSEERQFLTTDGHKSVRLCLGKPSWRCAVKSLRKRACTGFSNPIAHSATQMALRCFVRNLSEKNTGLRLVSKRGCVVKKHLQARLRGSFL
jgi:hypothetical protein